MENSNINFYEQLPKHMYEDSGIKISVKDLDKEIEDRGTDSNIRYIKLDGSIVLMIVIVVGGAFWITHDGLQVWLKANTSKKIWEMLLKTLFPFHW